MVFATLSQKRCLKKQTQKHGFSKTPKLPVVDEYLANYKHSWTWSKKPPENKRHTPRGGRRTCYLVFLVVVLVAIFLLLLILLSSFVCVGCRCLGCCWPHIRPLRGDSRALTAQRIPSNQTQLPRYVPTATPPSLDRRLISRYRFPCAQATQGALPRLWSKDLRLKCLQQQLRPVAIPLSRKKRACIAREHFTFFGRMH